MNSRADKKKIAYLGPHGTFTHEAAIRYFGPEEEFISRNTVKDVLHLYKIREVKNCVLAVESSIVGIVRENLDELIKIDQGFIVGEVLIFVHHHLMAKPGSDLHTNSTNRGRSSIYKLTAGLKDDRRGICRENQE